MPYDLGQGAGNPLVRTEKAKARIEQTQKNQEPFSARFRFFDTDPFVFDERRWEEARLIAKQHAFAVIWRDPTHEAFLLHHLHSHDTHKPDKRAADQALAKRWPKDGRITKNHAQQYKSNRELISMGQNGSQSGCQNWHNSTASSA